jgi:hypothetical protein
LGLNKDDAQDLNAASIESFPSLSVSEARLVLDKIIRRTTFSGIHDELSEEEKESSTLSFFPLFNPNEVLCRLRFKGKLGPAGT